MERALWKEGVSLGSWLQAAVASTWVLPALVRQLPLANRAMRPDSNVVTMSLRLTAALATLGSERLWLLVPWLLLPPLLPRSPVSAHACQHAECGGSPSGSTSGSMTGTCNGRAVHAVLSQTLKAVML